MALKTKQTLRKVVQYRLFFKKLLCEEERSNALSRKRAFVFKMIETWGRVGVWEGKARGTDLAGEVEDFTTDILK